MRNEAVPISELKRGSTSEEDEKVEEFPARDSIRLVGIIRRANGPASPLILIQFAVSPV